MKDRDILKLKFGLATVSVTLLLTGSKLLFAQWNSIHWSFWFLVVLITYGFVFRTFKLMNNKNVYVIFNGFEIMGTITYVIAIALTTIMMLIFYRHISLLFFGLSLATLSVFGGLKYIAFDFHRNLVKGLFDDRDLNLNKIIVDIYSGNNEIRIQPFDQDDILLLKKEEYSDRVWIQLIDNFQKTKLRA